MTDNEIIQALECCRANNRCDTCPRLGMNCCMNLLMQNALDLINRQREEIERFEKEKDSKLVMCIANDKDKIKSEAIKEFAERLKEKICCEDDCGYHCFDCCYECKDYVPVVDKLVKEMTEERKC